VWDHERHNHNFLRRVLGLLKRIDQPMHCFDQQGYLHAREYVAEQMRIRLVANPLGFDAMLDATDQVA
jgi:hypothetical protein